MSSHYYYEVDLKCYNSKGEIYLAAKYRYLKRHAALQKMGALRRHHPKSRVHLQKCPWVSVSEIEEFEISPSQMAEGTSGGIFPMRS
ncbi:MAG: hypothetical protein PHX83_03020 [Acidobacteriia bacterium]|nr:hypothetical protein [Terriglobia bacterium]